MGAWAHGPVPTTRMLLLRCQRSMILAAIFCYRRVYGNGQQRKMFGRSLRKIRQDTLRRQKVPPKNREWPARASATVDESYPPATHEDTLERVCQNLGSISLDLIQPAQWQGTKGPRYGLNRRARKTEIFRQSSRRGHQPQPLGTV